jgi:ATP-dependent Clp protease adaptor protein ClpS
MRASEVLGEGSFRIFSQGEDRRIRTQTSAILNEQMQAPRTDTDTNEKTEVRLATPWNVVVHDDPINLMVYVTHVFMRIFGYPRPRAERLMLEVHHTGRAVVWTGGREQAEVYATKLLAAQLMTTVERVDT